MIRRRGRSTARGGDGDVWMTQRAGDRPSPGTASTRLHVGMTLADRAWSPCVGQTESVDEPAHGGVGAGDAVVYRDATPEDMPFLREMTYEAAFWRADARRPEVEQALADEDIARYIPRLGEHGSIIVVAERAGEPVGAAWSRLFPA